MQALDILDTLLAPAATDAKAPSALTKTVSAVAKQQPATLPKLVDLPESYRAVARQRLDFIRRVKDAIHEGMTAPVAVSSVAAQYAYLYPLLTSAGKKGSSTLRYSTYRVWDRKIKGIEDEEQALSALCDNYRFGERQSDDEKDFMRVFHAFYLNANRLPMKQAYKLAAEKFRRDAPDRKIPSYDVVYYRAKSIPKSTLILAHQGVEAYKNQVCGYIDRDWTSVMAGDVVIGDSRDFDTRVRVWDEEKNCWRAVRPTVAALIDGRSWYFASWWITTEPVNATTLQKTLALYCRNSGGIPPRIAYFDNGKDYCKAGFSTPLEVEGYEHSIFRELGISLVNSLPYNGRAKTIERAFRDMMQRFDKRFADYLGSRPGQRTQAADYFDRHPEDLPSLQEFCEEFAAYVIEYNATQKEGKIHQGRSPQAIWESRRNDRPAMSPESLRMAFLLPECVRTVSRGPSVRWNNTLYYSHALPFDKKVLIKSDMLDENQIVCYHLDGRFLTVAKTREAIKALALDDPAERAKISEQLADQRRRLRDEVTFLRDLTGNGHLVSPRELLAAPIDAELRAAGTHRSVKGASHLYTHYNFIEDDKEAKQIEVAKVFAPEQEREEKTSKEDLAAFHNFLLKGRKDEED